jgi:hypothetical protein
MTKKDAGIFTRRVVGLVVGLIGILLLVFIIFAVFSRVFRPQDIAVMLPKDGVVAVMQVSTNSNNEQIQRFYDELNKYELYHPDTLKALISGIIEVDFDKDIYPWINRQVGAALVEKQGEKGQIDVLLFFETKDKNATLEFLKSRGLKTQEDYLLTTNYNGVDIYRYALSQTYNFMFIGSYLVMASNEVVLQSVIDSKTKLNSNPAYQKISQNLPINSLFFVYTDTGKLIDILKNNEGFMSEKGRELLAFEPFLKLYKAFGATAVMENGNLAIQTFTSLDEEYLSGKELIGFDTKFRSNLLDYVSEDVVFYVGGFDLQKQINRYSDLMSAGGEVSYLIFEGVLQSQKDKYLGQEIDLDEDVYPLLNGEYAFVVNKNDKNESVSLLLELADPLRDRDKVESIVDSFVRKSAILAPKVVEVELEDGTKMQEIQTVPEEISRSTENYNGYEINVLTVGTNTWGFYYIIIDNILVISTHQSQIHASIDLFGNSDESLKNGAVFRESISPVIRTTDEVLYFDLGYALNKFGLMPELFAGYLEPFKSVGSGTNYFKDGISSIHYIKID